MQRNYDSDFCGSVPLHQINLIQPHGYLLVLSLHTLEIIQLSENCTDLFGEPFQELIGKDFKEYIQPAELRVIEQKFDADLKEKIPLSFSIKGFRYLAIAHLKNGFLILEIEKMHDEKRYFTDVYQEVKYMTAAIDHENTLEGACKAVLKALKDISGFERILMYRFDEEWNGAVIAEETVEDMDHYLGLKFPASDIPKQARALYIKNVYRLISNCDYTPVKLYPVINPETHSFIDLSDCNLRSVAKVHLEYMKNMGISASMSIRVLKDGKLWGLITCHDRKPKYLDYEHCALFEMLSGIISNKITLLLNKEEFERSSALQDKQTRLIESVFAQKDIFAGLFGNKETLMMAFNATGAAYTEDGMVHTHGEVPDISDIENLVYWLQGKDIRNVWAINSLASVYDYAEAYSDSGSGLLVIPVYPERGSYILLFRPETLREEHWSGNPNEAINFNADRTNYHPRNSFSLWKETVKNTAAKWEAFEINAAESLKTTLYEFNTRKLLKDLD